MPPEQVPPVEPPAPIPVPPELLAWARQTLDLDEFEREVSDMLANGGRTFESFIGELEARAGVS